MKVPNYGVLLSRVPTLARTLSHKNASQVNPHLVTLLQSCPRFTLAGALGDLVS